MDSKEIHLDPDEEPDLAREPAMTNKLLVDLRLWVLLLLLYAQCFTSAAEDSLRWGSGILTQTPEWFASAQTRAVADSVLQYQSPQGGWPKSTDVSTPPRIPDDIPPPGRGRANSFDNEATTLPMHFLALVATATNDERYRTAFERGLDYTLSAQYPNGGWPQFFPLRSGYYSHITYNDNAMIRVLNLLRAAASGEAPFAFLSEDHQARRQAHPLVCAA